MTSSAANADRLAELLEVRPAGLDDFAALRYLYAKSLIAQTADAVTDDQAHALVHFIYSPGYSDSLLAEEIIGAWLDGELVGSAAWHVGREQGAFAHIGPVFARHPSFGIGGRLLGEVEARARQAGFRHLATWSTADAVPFFERNGYQVTSCGTKTFGPGLTLRVTFLRKDAGPLATPIA